MNRHQLLICIAATVAMVSCRVANTTDTIDRHDEEDKVAVTIATRLAGQQINTDVLFHGVMGVLNDDGTWRCNPDRDNSEQITFTSLTYQGGDVELSKTIAVPSGSYRFVSCAVSGGGTVYPEGGKIKITGGLAKADNDRIYASTAIDIAKTDDGTEQVAMNYQHSFAAVRFEIYVPSGLETAIEDVTITNADRMAINTEGVLDMRDGSVSETTTPFGAEPIVSSCDYFVVPCTTVQTSEVRIDYDGKSYAGTIQSLNLVGGQKTVIKLTLTKAEFQFGATVTDWDDVELNYDDQAPIDDENIYIPDPLFKAYLLAHFDKNHNGKISKAEAAVPTEINCPNLGIRYLIGVEHFTNLETLDCSGNDLRLLNLTKNTKLVTIDCSGNTSLNPLKVEDCTEVVTLDCNGCPTEQLSTAQMSRLTTLRCGGGRFTSIDLNAAKSSLRRMECDGGSLTSLDVSPHRQLQYLECKALPLNSLAVGNKPVLDTLVCSGTERITSIYLDECVALIKLDVGGNKLGSIDIKECTLLRDLSAPSNGTSSAIDLSKNTLLERIDVSDNKLTSLNTALCTGLTELLCYGNNISSLVVDTNLKLTTLDCSPMSALLTLTLSYKDLQYIDGINNLYNQDRSDEFVPASTKINYSGNAVIRDSKFKQYLVDNFDTGKDGEINHDEGFVIKTIETEAKGIYNIRGVEYLPMLESVSVKGRDDTEEQVDGSQLIKGGDGNLSSTVSLNRNINLTKLLLSGNPNIVTLQIDQCKKLKELDCHIASMMNTLDVTGNTELERLNMSFCLKISTVDLSKNTKLTYLNCRYCVLTSLDLSTLSNLVELDCAINNLTSLDVSYCLSLATLDYSGNDKMTKLYMKTGQTIATVKGNGKAETEYK